jgi:hypothetical protein
MAKDTDTPQTSNKAGVRSSAEKTDTSRHGFDEHPASRQKGGAFGEEGGRKAEPPVPGTASPRGKGAALDKLEETE